MAHGGKREGAGRKPGATEAEIKLAREAIAKFCDANSHKIQSWFDEVAADSPEKALEILYKYLEFHVPKLSRTDSNQVITGEITTNMKVSFVGRDTDPE